MFIQNNFEWSPQTSLEEFNPINDSPLHFNINNFNDNNTYYTNYTNDLLDPNYCDFNFEYQGLNNYLSPSNDLIQHNDEAVNNDINLDSDDSLKSILDEIESLPSDFFLEENVSSPSESSISDQQIQSPLEIESQINNFVFSNCLIQTESESATSSSGESEKSLEDDSSLKKVKSGRINKRESNKVAAVRYRAKKTKERDLLFQECDFYEKNNNELKEKLSDVEHEIALIKNLLVQALTAKR
jgi:hypothetical protein